MPGTGAAYVSVCKNFQPPEHMDSFKDSIAFWSTVLGTLLGLFGAVRSLAWLVVIGVVVVVGSVGALVYARKQTLRVKSATLKVGWRSIDSLNMASLRRHMNESLVVQRSGESCGDRRRKPRADMEMHRLLPGRIRNRNRIQYRRRHNIPFTELIVSAMTSAPIQSPPSDPADSPEAGRDLEKDSSPLPRTPVSSGTFLRNAQVQSSPVHEGRARITTPRHFLSTKTE